MYLEDIAMPESSDFPRLFNLGVHLLQNGDKQGAIMAWNEALSLNPKIPMLTTIEASPKLK